MWSRCRVQGLVRTLRDQGLGFRGLWGLGFKEKGVGIRIQGLVFKDYGSGFMVQSIRAPNL